MKFSAVMSVYQHDSPSQFNFAFESLLKQSVLPDQIVISIDGPVGEELERAIESTTRSPLVKLIRMPTNVGLGGSRHAAILGSDNDLIAVMDSDDVCAPNRFAIQLEAFRQSKIDLVGGYIEEFDIFPGDRPRLRTVPLTHQEILQRGRWRQPFNHVTIMFRRDMYLKVGGYQSIRFVEDFDMFHRMLISNMRFLNVPEVLVYVRSGSEVVSRRRGILYLQAELALFSRMHKSGFIGLTQLFINVATRVVARTLPKPIVGWLYITFLRSHR
jgi:glycosyltransferase involved in cell wall biosynthesis